MNLLYNKNYKDIISEKLVHNFRTNHVKFVSSL